MELSKIIFWMFFLGLLTFETIDIIRDWRLYRKTKKERIELEKQNKAIEQHIRDILGGKSELLDDYLEQKCIVETPKDFKLRSKNIEANDCQFCTHLKELPEDFKLPPEKEK